MWWRLALLLLVLAAVGWDLWIRLAPDVVARWNVPVGTDDPVTPGPCVEKVVTVHHGARAACLLPGTPEEVLAQLDRIALTHARTRRLAGTPADGRITWESRSWMWGFPDYITAEAVVTGQGTRLDMCS